MIRWPVIESDEHSTIEAMANFKENKNNIDFYSLFVKMKLINDLIIFISRTLNVKSSSNFRKKTHLIIHV